MMTLAYTHFRSLISSAFIASCLSRIKLKHPRHHLSSVILSGKLFLIDFNAISTKVNKAVNRARIRPIVPKIVLLIGGNARVKGQDVSV